MFSLQVPETVTVFDMAGANSFKAALMLGSAPAILPPQLTLKLTPCPYIGIVMQLAKTNIAVNLSFITSPFEPEYSALPKAL